MAELQEHEVGDGTSSVVLISAQLLTSMHQLVSGGIPAALVRSILIGEGLSKVISHLHELAVNLETCSGDRAQQSEYSAEVLHTLAAVTLSTKYCGHWKDTMASLAVQAVSSLSTRSSQIPVTEIQQRRGTVGKRISFTKLLGGDPGDSQLLQGAALLVPSVVVSEEKQCFEDIVGITVLKLVDTGRANANQARDFGAKLKADGFGLLVVQEQLSPTVAQALSTTGLIVFCGLTPHEMQLCASEMNSAVLPSCEYESFASSRTLIKITFFGTRLSGNPSQKFQFVHMCQRCQEAVPHVSIVLSGPSTQVLDELERGLEDAVGVLQCAVLSKGDPKAVFGGGCTEANIAHILRCEALRSADSKRCVFLGIAESLEIVPRILAENAGVTAATAITQLRSRLAAGYKTMGIEGYTGEVTDMHAIGVMELLELKQRMFMTAFNTVAMMLSVGDMVIEKAAEKLLKPHQTQ